MKKIQFWTHYNSRNNRRYCDTAVILDHVPEVGESIWLWGSKEVITSICIAAIDIEQPRREVFDYDIYHITSHAIDDDDDEGWLYIAVKNNDTCY